MKNRLTWSLWLLMMLLFVGKSAIAQINTPVGAVVPFGANPSYQYGIMPSAAVLPTGGTYGKSQDAANAYNEWKANYIVACGANYRVKFDDPSRTVSEGIAYGMLLSAYAADKALFDGLWAYYKANSNGRGIMNWRIDGCSGVSGSNGATDAELDAAYALLIAENQWPTLNSPYDYNAEANTLIDRIKQYEIHPSTFQTINGDGWGFSDNCRNPSYQSPAYYRFFATQRPADAGTWNSAISASYSLLGANAHATTGLVSDWSNQNGVRNTCNGSPIGLPTDGYGYDACRNPWRMAQEVIWHNNATAQGYCNKMAAYVTSRGATNVRGPLYQDGSLYSGNQHNATFVSTFAMAIMGSSASNQTIMDQMYTRTVAVKDQIQNVTLSGYFGNTLRCLSLFMMTGNFWKPGTTSQQDINVKVATTDIPTGTTYDFQNVIQTGNKVVTFTIENKGFNTLNLTGTPKVAISGTNAALFTINQTSVGASLAGNTSTTFTVTFAPGSTGLKTAVISIASNDPNENPYTINLIGTGTVNATAPKLEIYYNNVLISNNGSVNIGTIAAASNQTVPLVIKNTGDGPLNIASIPVSGTGYSTVAPLPPFTPSPIGVGVTDTLWVRANSATATTLTGFVTINSDDATNAAYKVNFTTSVVACGTAITTNKVYQDFDGNYANTTLDYTNPAWTELVRNPFESAVNSSYNVARHIRPVSGTYNGVRYTTCGTSTVNITATDYIISMLVYSPVAGTPVQMNLKTVTDVANTTTYPSRSSVTVSTTKTNQWERIYFNHTSAIGATGIKYIEVFLDPDATKGARTYYVDDIRLDVAPCLADIPTSGILNDFDDHRNISLAFGVNTTDGSSYDDVFANPSATGINTSATVAKYVRNDVNPYDLMRYAICGNNLDLSAGKTIIAIDFYSTKAGVPIELSLKTGTAGNPSAVGSTQAKTTRVNAWETLYFDFTAYQGNTTVKAIDIFVDPNMTNVASAAARVYYFDNIRYVSVLPCVSQILTSGILNDFDNNRNLNLAYNPAGSFNDFAVNPVTTGINTSATVFNYVRPAATAGVVSFKSCGSFISLTPGKSVISAQVLSNNANAEYIVSLKKLDGTTELAQAYAIGGAANVWTELNFDFSQYIGSEEAVYLEIIPDPNSAFTTTVAQRTYNIDNIRYSTKPEINVKNGSTNVLNGSTLIFAPAVIIGDSIVIPLNIVNNGGGDLLLNGTPTFNITGVDATSYYVIKSPSFNSTVTPGSTTGFSVVFKPVSGGAKLAAIEIANNDSDENPYYINLSGTGLAPEINVKQGTTNILNTTGTYSFGSVNVGSTSSSILFTIENLGTGILNLTGTPIVAISGANAADFTITQPLASTVAAAGNTTYTISFTPSATGLRSATISIANNDSDENPYTFTISGTGTTPDINIRVATTNYLTASTYDFGTFNVGSTVTPVTFTLENIGTGLLSLTGTPNRITLSGTDAASFTLVQTAVTATVAASTSVTYTVAFNPSTAGTKTAILTIPSNDPDEPSYVINLTGIAVTNPEINVKQGTTSIPSTTGSYTFTSTTVGSPLAAVTFTIENTGNGVLNLTGTPVVAISGTNATDFVIVQPTGTSVAAAGTLTYTIQFNPATPGAKTATISIASNDSDENPYTFTLNGTAVAAAAPEINVKVGITSIASGTGTFTFTPSVAVGSSSAAILFTVENTGNAALNLTGTPKIQITGTEFVVNQTTTAASVPAASTTTFTVTFTPTSAGAKTATVTILNNDSDEGTYTFTLNATATASPEINVKQATTNIANNGTYAFASAIAGTSSTPVTFTIENIGNANLTVGTITLAGTDAASFSITQSSSTTVTGPTGTATFTVTFSPATVGAKTATISIANDDSDESPYIINLTGTATAVPAPEMNLKQGVTVIASGTGMYNFPSTPATTSSTPATFIIENIGNANLTVGTVSISGTDAASFSVTQATGTTVTGPTGTTTFTVTFSPTTVGSKTATISIVNNDSDENPYTFTVTGTATAAPAPEINVRQNTTNLLSGTGSYAFTPSVAVGSSSPTVTFTIDNLGTAALNLTGTPKVQVTGTDFVVNSTTTAASVGASLTTTFTITFTPTSAGAKSATVSIANNDSDENPYTFTVTGTATANPEINVKQGTSSILTTGTYAFASVLTGSSSAPITFTIENLGNADLTVGTISLTGTDAASFSVTQAAGTTVTGPTGTTTFTVTFSPTTVGSKTAAVSIVNNDSDENPYVINLTGTATAAPAPEVNLKQAATVIASGTGAFTFPSTPATTSSAAVTFTIENLGSAALTVGTISSSSPDFTVTQAGSTSITGPTGTTTFTVTFNPTTIGAKTGTISIVNNDSDENPYTFTVNGTATAAPSSEINIKQGINNIASGTGNQIFPSVVAGTSGTPLTFTIENTGAAALTVGAISLSGTDASSFTVTQAVTTTVAAGSTTTFTIAFNPATAGLKNATVSIVNSDSDENPYTFTLTGTATAAPAPEINVKQVSTSIVSGGTFDFGSSDIGVGNTLTFTIENIGSAALTIGTISSSSPEFTVTQATSTSINGPSGTATFTITFTPTSAGAKSTSISIVNNDSDENPYTFTVTGTGAASPEINVKQGTTNIATGTGTYSFTSVPATTSSAPITFTIENLGTADLTVGAISSSSSDFTVTQATSTTVAGGISTTFTVTFTPATVGSKTGTISIVNNDGNENPYTFTVNGTATAAAAPEINVAQGSTNLPSGSGNYSFGTQQQGVASAAVTFTVQNTGTADLTIGTITKGGANPGDFTITQVTSSTVIGSSSTTFTVVFTPSASGSRSASISIPNNDSDENPYTFIVSGSGSAVPVAEINVKQGTTNVLSGSGTYGFGTRTIGTSSAAVSFTIENTGNADLTVGTISLGGLHPGDFSVTQATSATVTGGTTTTFTVTFTPTVSGARSAVVSISNNDGDENPYTFTLTGSGTTNTTPPISVSQNGTTINSGSTFNFGTQQQNVPSSSMEFTITNTSASAITLGSIVVSGANFSDFVVSQPSSSTIAAGGTATFTITFTPSALGARNANVSIGTPGGPYLFLLTGTGSTSTGTTVALSNGSIDVFPNPSVADVNLEFNIQLSEVKFKVYDAVGQQVMNEVGANYSAGSIATLNFANLPEGVYFVEIDALEGKAIKRVVKQ
ncbi:MAG: glycosyl hydrolase family 8 [Cytophagaceae bacterium]